MRLVKTNVHGFSKDMSTGAILNTDTRALAEFHRRRDIIKRWADMEAKIASLEARIATLESGDKDK